MKITKAKMNLYHTVMGSPVIAFAIGVTIIGFGAGWALKHGINLALAAQDKFRPTSHTPTF